MIIIGRDNQILSLDEVGELHYTPDVGFSETVLFFTSELWVVG